MAPVTRAAQQAAYVHIRDNVIKPNAMTDEIVKALDELGINVMSDLLCEKLETFEKMQAPHTTKDSAGNDTTVMKTVQRPTVR
ncbi:MAG: hypothetical protein LC687_02525 [Actinobacteria bacterium]|nr:hypothetical protein [Actinomycetota bacterium]